MANQFQLGPDQEDLQQQFSTQDLPAAPQPAPMQQPQQQPSQAQQLLTQLAQLRQQRQEALQNQGAPTFADRYRMAQGLPTNAELQLKSLQGQEDELTKQAEQAKAIEASDPSSASSKKAQSVFKAMMLAGSKQTGQPLGDADLAFVEQLPAQAIAKMDMQKMAELYNTAQENKAKIAHYNQMAQEKTSQLSDKKAAAQDKAMGAVEDKLQGVRGNRALNQAKMNMLSADNALALIQGRDLNKLTPQDIRLLQSEIAKVATGGVPTERGQEELMPKSLALKAAEFQSFLSSNPTPANVGAFLQRNMAYLQELKKISEQHLKKYQKEVLEGHRHELRPEDYKELKMRHGLEDEKPQEDIMVDPKSGRRVRVDHTTKRVLGWAD